MYSDTYRLSDGSFEARIYSGPIRFKDSQGAWQGFNTSLVGVGPAGVYHSADTPAAITLGSASGGSAPAVLSADGYTVTWSVQNTTAGVPVAPEGSVANYMGVAPDTSLSYTVQNWGVEQSLVLSSSAAPDSFTCTLSHPGLTLAQDPTTGQWNLYAPGDPNPIFGLSGIDVYDSSRDQYGNAAVCSAATMAVSPGNGQSTLTYSVPRSWLSDPARVYPVTIDPVIFLFPYAGDNDPSDTFVNDTPPSDTHGPATNLLCGDDSTYGKCRPLVSFNLSGLAGAYVHSAALSIWKFYQGTSSPNIWLCPKVNGGFSYGSSWTSLGFVRNTFTAADGVGPYIWEGTIPVSTTTAWSHDVTSTVQGWLTTPSSDEGFVFHEDEDNSYGTSYESKFYSVDYDGGVYAPELTVYYDQPSVATNTDSSVYQLGSQVTVSAQVNTWYPGDVRAVFVSPDAPAGSPGNFGEIGWFVNSSEVPSGWTTGEYKLADGSYVAYDSNLTTADITLDGSSCSDSTTSSTMNGSLNVNLVFTINSAFGAQAAITPDTALELGPGSDTWQQGWTTQSGGTFAMVDTLPSTLTYQTQTGSTWFNSSGGALDNSDSAGGRGAVTLMWPTPSSGPTPTGYHVYLNDGRAAPTSATSSSGWHLVGTTLGAKATTWSTPGLNFYPSDTEIGSYSTDWPAGNPFYRATTPSQGTQLSSMVPSGIGAEGLCLSDGSYLYVRQFLTDAGPSSWTKVGTGYGGTTADQVVGTVGAAQTAAKTAFLLPESGGDALYDGYVNWNGNGAWTLGGIYTSGAAAPTLTFAEPPLLADLGTDVTDGTGSTGDVLLCESADASGTQHVYSVAYSLTSNNMVPNYDGYQIRDYTYNASTETLNVAATHTIKVSSAELDGVISDGNFIYLMNYSGAATATVTKVSTTTWQIVNQWTTNQGTTGVLGGCEGRSKRRTLAGRNGQHWDGSLAACLTSFQSPARGPA